MRRRSRAALVPTTLVAALLVSPCLFAASSSPSLPAHQTGPLRITLGQAAFPLNGPWKFSVGDSPLDPANGEPLWAEPRFDDSSWETVDLTPAAGSYEPIQGIPSWVPGWTSKGHPGYWGYAWYRIRIVVDWQNPAEHGGTGLKLALEGPIGYDDVYQVFANGNLLGGFGKFSGRRPVEYFNVPKMFPLPLQNSIPAAGAQDSLQQVLAFRLWMGPETLESEPEAGGLHDPPLLGKAAAVLADYKLNWLDLVRAVSPAALLAIFYAQLAVITFSLVLFDRTDRVYLWIGAVFLLQSFYGVLEAVDSWTQFLSITADGLVGDCLIFSLIMACWTMVWWTWFGQKRPAWIPHAVVALTVFSFISRAVGNDLLYGLVPHSVAAHFWVFSLLARVLFFALMLGIVIQGIRTQGLEGWLVLPAVLLRSIGVFSGELRLLGIRMSVHWLGANITVSEIATLLMALAVALLLLRRLLRSVKAQRQLALDVKQAQEVQQVILAEAHMAVPGFSIESVYRPAREVGGDFFQIIPHPADGSLLIVAGDVAGKGLPAGMMVALLVGVIRTVARFDPDPVTMLGELNQRLLGRGDASATCLAMRISPDGAVTLANAGHLPPWLNGKPLPMEGALPLGFSAAAQPSVTHFALQPDDKLVLTSDGIVEAMNPQGQLFGFERTATLLGQAVSAASIADAALAFGQMDDISVISLRRLAIPEPA
ncbi:MAG: SpoIIE family protein phosphatase [Acidobacteriaceae bacterium]